MSYQIKAETLINELLSKSGDNITVKVTLNPRMRTTAGRAFYLTNEIHLNIRLLSENPHHFEQTIAHELAHLVAHHRHGPLGKGHGSHWKYIMRTLGYSPTRCHSLNADNYRAEQRVRAYAQCGCNPRIPIKTKRYNKIKRGASYRCTLCEQRLTLTWER